ncbi:hypothetical protein APHAL10511_004770 [Amanita phalloides]|nr:hypothetical protein APHAL10511_004770 [Amanita phalloides]
MKSVLPMDELYTPPSPSRTLRKVKRLPLLHRGTLGLSDEPLYPPTRYAQNDDEQKRQQAYQDLVTVWQERLQLISAISTFFSSVDSGMLGLVVKPELTPMSSVAQIANATFLGALIIHVFSAFVAFMASFLLIDYRIHETETELPRGVPSDKGIYVNNQKHGRSISVDIPTTSANPRVVQVGPFKRLKPPLHLIGRCHSLCVTLASTGILLAFIGACCFAWTSSQHSVSIFASICIGMCMVLCVLVVGLYDTQSIVIKESVAPINPKIPATRPSLLPAPGVATNDDDMSNMFNGRFPSGLHIYTKSQEPLPPGLTENDRPDYERTKKWEGYMVAAMESCPTKTAMAGAAGLGIGAFFSLMSASFAYEDPLMRQQTQAGKNTAQKARDIFKEMGRGMWSTGKGFGKVGALFAGIECVIESYRAKNDIYNSVASGFLAGAVLARNSGPKAAFGGGLAFAAFSTAIDLFLRREPPDED